jgi:hypothetical protein
MHRVHPLGASMWGLPGCRLEPAAQGEVEADAVGALLRVRMTSACVAIWSAWMFDTQSRSRRPARYRRLANERSCAWYGDTGSREKGQ